MRRTTIAIVSLVLLVGAAPLAWGTADDRQAGLKFAATAPVKLKGTGFRARELVKVTLTVNGTTRIKRLRATTAGAFSVTFQGETVTDRCSGDVSARASGARGSVARAKLPQPYCPPRLGPPTP